MGKICIHIPDSELAKSVGVEVTVGDHKQFAEYRVESFSWPEGLSSVDRIDRLRGFVEDYGDDWELVQIGPAVRESVPVTFRKR